MKLHWKPTLAVIAVVAALAAVPVDAQASHETDADRPCPHRSTDDITAAEVAAGKAPAIPVELKGVPIRCVHVGGGDVYPRTGQPVTLTRFYPDVLQVHPGDIVEFRPAPGWAGTLHMPAFLPADPDADGPAIPLVRPDEHPPGIAFHQDIATGSGLGDSACGLKTGSRGQSLTPQLPCEITSEASRAVHDLNEAFINVGRPEPFWIRMNVEPGLYRIHCTYHGWIDDSSAEPWMSALIEVVDPSESVPTHDEVAEQAEASAAADMAEAMALKSRLDRESYRVVDGRRVYRVTTGATTDSGRATIISYMPAGLTVRPGDAVEFVAGRPDAPTPVGRTGEGQTVTFPAEAVGGFFLGGCSYDHCNGLPPPLDHEGSSPAHDKLRSQAVPHGLTLPVFPFGCEYDDWDSGLPALPTWMTRVGCAKGPDGEPGKFEFVFSEISAFPQRAPGNAITTPASYHNTGWMAPDTYAWPTRPDGSRWPTTFDAVFPNEGGFTYACLFHPDVMKGSVNVARPS